MKVALAVRRFSRRGGLESNTFELARYLVERGHEVHVLCQRIEDEIPGLNYHRLSVLRVLGEWPKILSFARAVHHALPKLDADVSFSAAHVYGVDVVRLEGGLVDDHVHAVGRAGPLARLKLETDPAERAAGFVETRRLARAQRILTLSEASRSRLVDLGHSEGRVAVVRNGIDPARFRPAASDVREQARADFGVDGLCVAFIGTNYRRKGLEALIQAAAQAEGRPHLLIAGYDRSAPRYRKAAEALGVKATFLGQVEDLAPVFAACDALALPSLYEAFGLVVLEALASGRPVVLSRACGASEVAPHPELIVDDPLDVTALAGALDAIGPVSKQPNIEQLCRAPAESYTIRDSFEAIEQHLTECAR